MPKMVTDRHSEVGDGEKEEPEELRIKEPIRKTGRGQPKEQHEVTERGKPSKTGEPAKLTPWATGHIEEQSKNKQGGQLEGTLKKLGSRMREIWRTTPPKEKAGRPVRRQDSDTS